ncbi:MAG: lysophospholipid acyltransferase family protein [Thermoanaerobaculia bacterium]
MAMLRTVWAWSAAFAATLVFGTGAILTAWIPPRGALYLRWARGWARTVLVLSGIPVRVEVSQLAEAMPEAIFMPNHGSAIDILVLFLAVQNHQVRFLAKRSLFSIPFLGWSMGLAGFVPVDRDRKDRAREVFEELSVKLRQGLSLVVFPEGTRSRTGELGAFKKSGFLLALKSGMPIVPIGISGARDVLGARGILLRPGVVTVRVGEPIPTAGLGVSHRRELMRQVRREIIRLSSASPG